MMRIAQRMRTLIQKVAGPTVMHADAVKVWQDVHSLNRFLAPLGVNEVVGQLSG